MTQSAEKVEPACGALYGSNPDACHREPGHTGSHSNRWGTTWATAAQWLTRVTPPGATS